MLKTPKPSLNYLQVFDACVNSSKLQATKDFFIPLKADFIGATAKFDELAQLRQIGDFENRFRHHADKELKEITIELFTKFKKNKIPSTLCDQIKIISPLCLYCGVSLANTLDHYLPKAEFPLLVISPNNLIPCCSVCNTQLNSVYDKNNPLIIHPYYEHDSSIYDSQWIFADIPLNQPFFTQSQAIGLGVKFYTDFTPTSISPLLQTRLQFQFDTLISKPYEIFSAGITSAELNGLRQKNTPCNKYVYQGYLRHLARKHNHTINSLHHILYQALANSEAYLEKVEAIF